MLQLIKNLFRREEPEFQFEEPLPATMIHVPKSAPKKPVEAPRAQAPNFRPTGPLRVTPTPQAESEPVVSEPHLPEVEDFDVPLEAVIDRLPEDLKAFFIEIPSDAPIISVPVSGVHEQLKRGAVKVTFGAVRKATPAEFVLGSDADNDRLFVEIPLKHILPQVSYSQRPHQRKIAVPASVAPGFDLKGSEDGTANEVTVESAEAPASETAAPEAPSASDSGEANESSPFRLSRNDNHPLSAEQPAPKNGNGSGNGAPAKKLRLPEPEPEPEAEQEGALGGVTLDLDLEDYDDAPAARPAVTEPTPPRPETTLLPDQVAAAAVKLQGVAGALIASHDGLPIEDRMPADLDGSVLAAFLPELVVRTRVYLNEMSLPEQDSIVINVADRRLEVWLVRGVYFAVISEEQKSLPSEGLIKLANRLKPTTTKS